eukprot:1177791-Prymnesium_polylepis.1
MPLDAHGTHQHPPVARHAHRNAPTVAPRVLLKVEAAARTGAHSAQHAPDSLPHRGRSSAPLARRAPAET